jgi:DNA polymerase III epsilon subunit family exonuclease
VNPQRRLSPEAMRVNGITPSMVANAPIFCDLLDQLLPLLENVVLVCHNVPFDLRFLEAELRKADAPIWDGVALDTLAFARRQYWFRRNNLSAIARQLNIRADDSLAVCAARGVLWLPTGFVCKAGKCGRPHLVISYHCLAKQGIM